MSSLADRSIAALRGVHEDLAALVPTLTEAQLAGPSGASEWSVAHVLSHLGSAAEISIAAYSPAIHGAPEPDPDFNKSVWDRWNAMNPADQAAGFLKYDAAMVALVEDLPSEKRESIEIKLGFLPMPLPLASIVGMRLNETAQHTWDVKVALDPAATVDETAAEVLIEHFSGGLGFLLGFTGKVDQVDEPAVVALTDIGVDIAIADSVSISPSGGTSTATMTGAPETLIRLLGGRLTQLYTPASVAVTGNITLEDLRKVFPGY